MVENNISKKACKKKQKYKKRKLKRHRGCNINYLGQDDRDKVIFLLSCLNWPNNEIIDHFIIFHFFINFYLNFFQKENRENLKKTRQFFREMRKFEKKIKKFCMGFLYGLKNKVVVCDKHTLP